MASILTSLGRTVLAGFVLLVLIILALGGNFSSAELPFIFRWLHVMFGAGDGTGTGSVGTIIIEY